MRPAFAVVRVVRKSGHAGGDVINILESDFDGNTVCFFINVENTFVHWLEVAVIKGEYEGETVWVAVQEFGLPLSACPQPEAALKNQIGQTQNQINNLKSQIEDKIKELESEKFNGRQEYNQKINEYNELVNQYNNLIETIKFLISNYNNQVNDFNVCYNET